MRRAVTTVAAAVLLVSGCGGDPESSASVPSASPEEPQSASPSKNVESLTGPDDVRVNVTKTKQQCFGDTCNVTARATLEIGALGTAEVLDGDYDVTYEIRGGADGPVIDTFEVYSRGTYDGPQESVLQTPGPNVRLTAVVTAVQPIG